MKIQLHAPLPTSVVDHGALTGPEPTLEDLQAQQVALQNRILERQRAQQEQQKVEEQRQRQTKGNQACKAFDDLLAATLAERKRFALLLRDSGFSLGSLARSAHLLSETYNLIVQCQAPFADEARLAQLRNATRPPNEIVLDLVHRYGTTLGTGYDWLITIPVLKMKGE